MIEPKIPGGTGKETAALYEGTDLELLAVLTSYRDWIVSQFAPHLRGHIVEYGAGTGNFSELLVPFADRLDLVEPSLNLIPALHQKFDGHSSVRVIAGTLEETAAATPPESHDTVVTVNVLEHIEDDMSALEGFRRTLKPGGALLIFVPAMPSLYSEMDRKVGHFRRYRGRDLQAKCRSAGFAIVKQRYFDILGVIPWWLINRVMGSTSFDHRLARIYDRYFVPVGRMIESVVHPPIGKNIILVARRPGVAEQRA